MPHSVQPGENPGGEGGGMKFRIVLCVGLVLSLSGCGVALVAAGPAFGRAVGVSSAKGNMARATALALGNNTNPDSIKISDSHVGAHEARWVADTPSGRYDCNDNGGVTGPAYCAKR